MNKYSFSFPSTEEAFRISDSVFATVIDTFGGSVSEKHRMKIIVSELFMNAYLHGNKIDQSKYIDVILEIEDDEFVAIVKDQGSGFTRERFRSMVDSISEPESKGGRGIKIVHKLSDRIQLFMDKGDKFCIKASKKLAKESALAD